MIHFTNYIYSLKLSWIRRLVINDSNYKLLFENAYTSVKSLVTRGVKYVEHIKICVKINFGLMSYKYGVYIF